MYQLLLGDFLHLLSQTLQTRKEERKKQSLLLLRGLTLGTVSLQSNPPPNPEEPLPHSGGATLHLDYYFSRALQKTGSRSNVGRRPLFNEQGNKVNKVHLS